jgi:hypothetical protein
MYIYAPNGTAETYPFSIGQLRKDNPQVSFPKNPTDALLASYNVFPVTRTERPEYDSVSQNLTEATPALIAGVWTQMWTTSDATPEEIEQRTADLASSVRAQRDDMLAASDWSQLTDAPVDQATWAAYRQALRDVPEQPGFPLTVNWPSEP